MKEFNFDFFKFKFKLKVNRAGVIKTFNTVMEWAFTIMAGVVLIGLIVIIFNAFLSQDKFTAEMLTNLSASICQDFGGDDCRIYEEWIEDNAQNLTACINRAGTGVLYKGSARFYHQTIKVCLRDGGILQINKASQ